MAIVVEIFVKFAFAKITAVVAVAVAVVFLTIFPFPSFLSSSFLLTFSSSLTATSSAFPATSFTFESSPTLAVFSLTAHSFPSAILF